MDLRSGQSSCENKREPFTTTRSAGMTPIVFDVPDDVSAAAVSLAANQSGAIASETIVLLTPEDMDKAAEKAVGFRPPGK